MGWRLMETVLGRFFVGGVFVKTFFIVLYNSGHPDFQLGFCLSNFLSA